MIIPIVGASALEFWLSGVSAFPSNQFSIQNRKLVSLPEEYRIPYSQNLYRDISTKYHLSLPVHVMAEKASGRISNQFLSAYKRPKHLPEDSFIQINDIYMSSPELCFIQMANKLPLPKLIEVANNLCAAFSLDTNATYGQSSRTPFVTVQDLKDYLCRATKFSGIQKARKAINYASDNSFSPMESKLATLAALPVPQGGYGLPKPVMNCDILLTNDAAAFLGRKSCKCDLVWENRKVIVEYDSNLSHLSVDQHAYDKRKANALNMSGYNVFYITADNMHSFKDIENTFFNLRKMLGLRLRTSVFESNESKRRETVHMIVFDSLKKYIS